MYINCGSFLIPLALNVVDVVHVPVAGNEIGTVKRTGNLTAAETGTETGYETGVGRMGEESTLGLIVAEVKVGVERETGIITGR